MDHEDHRAFHQIWEWNQDAFRRAREKEMKEFDKRLGPRKKKEPWSSPRM